MVTNGNSQEFNYIITIAVAVGGWIFSYLAIRQQEKRLNKTKAYESVIQAYWKLLNLASRREFAPGKYYEIMENASSLALWASKKIHDQSVKLDILIFDHMNKLDAEASQKDIIDEMNILVNMLRKDLSFFYTKKLELINIHSPNKDN